MTIERKQILKRYLLLCEGRDAEGFLIQYLNSSALARDKRFASDIQVLNFGGNNDLSSFLLNLKNMQGFDGMTSLAVIRDAERDYSKACRQICNSFGRCGFMLPERSGEWYCDDFGMKTGFMLFPFDGNAGTLEDLCLKILREENNQAILSSVDTFLDEMESYYGRSFHRIHKNKLHTYLSSSDDYVTMPLGTASKAGAFDWMSDELNCFKQFLIQGFS